MRSNTFPCSRTADWQKPVAKRHVSAIQPGHMRWSRPRPRAIGATNCATHTATKICARQLQLQLRLRLRERPGLVSIRSGLPKVSRTRAPICGLFCKGNRFSDASLAREREEYKCRATAAFFWAEACQEDGASSKLEPRLLRKTACHSPLIRPEDGATCFCPSPRPPAADNL